MSAPSPHDAADASGRALLVHRERRRALIASTLGTTLEWYDFNLYGLAAALVFPRLFFPDAGPLVGTLASFATFAIGFIARPLGGALFGHFGDRYGRKNVLIATLLVMGIATTLIGCIPTYETIGIGAPILLIVLRVCQGVGVGGEFAGATLLTIENAPADRRGLFGAIPAMGTGAGFLAASAMFAGVASMGDETLLAWGWRIPFLFSAALVVLGIVLRRQLHETSAFEEAGGDHRSARPVVEAFTQHRGAIARTIGITVSGFVWGYMIQAFVYSYGANELHIPRATLLTGTTVAAALEIATIPFWGWLSDKLGRKPVILGGLIAGALYAWPFFLLLETREPWLVVLALVVAVPIVKDAVFGPQAALVAELFSTKVRYSGVSVGRELSGAIFGGTAPFVGTALYAATGRVESVVAYVVVAMIVTFVAVATAPETAGGSLA